jgi:hypothetical protein
MRYLMFLLLIILDLIFSAGTSYFILTRKMKRIDKNSSCGTGSIGEAIIAWVVVVVIFIILLAVYGSLLYWIMFLLL